MSARFFRAPTRVSPVHLRRGCASPYPWVTRRTTSSRTRTASRVSSSDEGSSCKRTEAYPHRSLSVISAFGPYQARHVHETLRRVARAPAHETFSRAPMDSLETDVAFLPRASCRPRISRPRPRRPPCIFCRRGIALRCRRGVFSYTSACGRGASGHAGKWRCNSECDI